MEDQLKDTATAPLRAIMIDPDTRRVDLIEVEPDAVAMVLGSALSDTIDFEDGHCLVLDHGGGSAEHSTRFHLAKDRARRPYFGPVLILGLAHGNWTHATLPLDAIRARITWEHWDAHHQRYGATAVKEV